MPTTNVALVLALTGCLALLAGLFGGGFKAEQVEVPKIGGAARFLSGLIGLALIGTGIWLYMRPFAQAAPQPTESPKPGTLSAAESQAPATLTQLPPTATEAPTTAATTIVPNDKTAAGSLSLYFAEISRGDYTDAWLQLNPKYQKNYYPGGSLQFRNDWFPYKSIELKIVSTVDNGTSADFAVDLTLHTQNGGTTQKTGQLYHMTYDIRRKMWRIDVP